MNIIDLVKLIEKYGSIFMLVILILFFLLWLIKQIVYFTVNNVFSEQSSKQIQNHINTLNRKRMAYDILLKKELEYYEKISEYISDLVVQIQDVEWNYNQTLKSKNKEEKEKYNKWAIDNLKSILENIPGTKKDTIIYQNYADENIWASHSEIISFIQNKSEILVDILLKNNKSSKNTTLISDITKEVLLMASTTMVLIQTRQKKLSE